MGFITVGEGGPRNARTDPESGLRFYTWEGRELVSVTTVRRLAGLPFKLHQWQIGQVIDYALNHSQEIHDQLRSGDPAAPAVIRSALRHAADAKRDEAAALGTAVHDAAAAGRGIADVPADIAPRLRQYQDWLRVSGAEIIASEFQVWNLAIGYAGTVDLLVSLKDGTTWLVDIKTGSGVYSDHALQVMAYAQAEFVGNDGQIDEYLTAALSSVSGIAILHLADDHWEFRSVRFDVDTWTAFRGLVAFAMWSKDHATPDSFTVASRKGSDA